MSRTLSKPTAFVLVGLGLVAAVACDLPAAGPGTSNTRITTTPKPTSSASGGPGQASASASPSASSDPNKVGGGVQASAPPSSEDRFVAVEPANLMLNAPSADGSNPAGFASSRSLRAIATLSEGGTVSADVTWTSNDTSRLTVDASGSVSVKSGAATGSVVVTAESRKTPGVKGLASVSITADGLVRVTFSPPMPTYPSFRKETDVTVKRQGATVAAVPALGESLDVRVAAGSGYRLLVNRTIASDSVSATNGFLLSTGFADPVTVSVNAIATVSVTLQATNSLPQ